MEMYNTNKNINRNLENSFLFLKYFEKTKKNVFALIFLGW